MLVTRLHELPDFDVWFAELQAMTSNTLDSDEWHERSGLHRPLVM